LDYIYMNTRTQLPLTVGLHIHEY